MHHLSVPATAAWVDDLLLDGPGDAPCLHFGEAVTRGRLRGLVVDAQRELADQGVGQGGSVAVCLPPSVALVTHLLACLRLGAQVTVIDPRLTGPERKAVLESVRPRLLLWAEHTRAPLRGFHNVDVRVERLPEGRAAETDHVLVQISSGSTDTPKRIGRSAESVRQEIESLAMVEGMPGPGERVVVLNSLVHSMGLLTGLLYDLHVRAEIVVPSSMTARGIMNTLTREHTPTTVFGVPFHADLLRSVADPPSLPSLKAVATAGEIPTEGIAQSFEERYGISLGNLYGMTEVGLIAVDPLGRARPSAGKPLPGTRVLAEEGELLVSCLTDPYLEGVSGRWADGWLRTRDAGTVDPGGEVTVLGRLDSQVSIGGLKVNLTEVEHRLVALPGVMGAVVLFDSGIEAFAEVEEGITARGIEEGLAEVLAPYKRPTRVHVSSRLARTSSGKLSRDIRRLKNPAREHRYNIGPASLPSRPRIPSPFPDASDSFQGSRLSPTRNWSITNHLLESPMTEEIRALVVKTLEEMSFPTDDLEDDTVLGPENLGLDSLAFAEIIVQVEEECGVRFPQEDAPTASANITLAAFVSTLADAVAAAKKVSAP